VANYFVETNAPQARAQASANLLASAPPANSGDWENGVSFLGETCPELTVFDPCDDMGGVNEEESVGTLTFLSPLGYRMWTECSTLDVNGDLARDRLARQADAVASYALARELAEGAGSTANPFTDPYGASGVVNPFFADGQAEVLTAATSILQGLGALEQAARDKTKGQQVFLHVPIVIATQVAMSLQRVGNEIRTFTDAVVVADAGYSGKGPGGQAGVWGYATGPVFTRLGPVIVEANPSETINRRTNRRTVWADRPFLAGYDPCASVAIKFP
jgi:hypothetical protein